jgi:hypothetical protein
MTSLSINTSTRNPALQATREKVWPCFERLALTLDFYFSNDDKNPLSVDTISAFRTALSTPSTFTHILMYQITKDLPPLHIDVINVIYDDFCSFIANHSLQSPHLPLQITTSSTFHNLSALLQRLKSLKREHRSIRVKIMNSTIFDPNAKQIFIHRIQSLDRNLKSVALGKHILLHGPHETVDPFKFPSSEYHHLKQSPDNTIEPVGDSPQMHLIVEHDAPSDQKVLEYIHELRRENQDITKEKWLVGGAIFNLFNEFPEILDSLSWQMQENVGRRNRVIRGVLRQGLGDMFGLGECRDQQGNVRPYHNLKKGLPENIKFAIDENASIILDICIMVFPHL